jgi:hypothetical protein
LQSVTLQINLAASDYLLSKSLLERQLALFNDHVDEIVISLDGKQGTGRFSVGFNENFSRISGLIDSVSKNFDKLRIITIDYTFEAQSIVNYYFGQKSFIPLRDLRGGPCYVYFYGLWSCKNDLVLHIDADMFFGGKVGDWFDKAVTLLADPSVFAVAPLPGPPTTDGHLAQPLLDHSCIEEDRTLRVYSFDGFSTRIFLLDRRKLFGIPLRGFPSINRATKAILRNLSPRELPEVMITRYMRRQKLKRVDFASSGNLYSLHPPYKSEKFYAAIPGIIEILDENRIPDGQLGCYDINDALFDFSEERYALAQNAWSKRLAKYLKS